MQEEAVRIEMQEEAVRTEMQEEAVRTEMQEEEAVTTEMQEEEAVEVEQTERACSQRQVTPCCRHIWLCLDQQRYHQEVSEGELPTEHWLLFSEVQPHRWQKWKQTLWHYRYGLVGEKTSLDGMGLSEMGVARN